MRSPVARSAPSATPLAAPPVAPPVVLTAALAAALVVATAGCSGSGATPSSVVDPAASSTASPSATSPTLSSATGSTTATPTAIPTVTVTVTGRASSTPEASAPTATPYPRSQQSYTSQLVRAWGVGSRTLAGRYAAPAAVRRLFAIGPGGPNWSLVGCDNAGPRPACTFADPGQGQRLVVFYDADKLGRAQAVVDAQFIADDPFADVQ